LGNSLAILRSEANSFRGSAFASTTKKTYRSHLKSYINFCSEYGVTPIPATQDTLIAYMVFLARTLSPNSIPGYMNIIRILHLDAGFQNPLSDNWDLKMVYKGITRQLGKTPNQKSPITLYLLIQLHRTLEDTQMDASFWFACLTAFYGFLRKSTLLPAPGGLVDGKFISRADITEITLFVRSPNSKE
jgi:hypothetical protein